MRISQLVYEVRAIAKFFHITVDEAMVFMEADVQILLNLFI